MRKYAKLYALLGVGLLMGACQDDYGFEPIVINPGDDIQFGANANFEAGDEETRTIYGDTVTDENGSFIEVKWLEGIDKVDIACEQAIGTMIAEYTVGNVSLNTTSHASSAQQLTKTGDVGLQWSNSTDYVFHAMYPSKECLKEKLIKKGMTSEDVASLGLDYTKTAHNSDIVRGYLPMNQSPSEVVPTENGYVATPDMNFAYMLAQKKYSTSSNKNVGLSFQSLVTALQFDITAGSLGASAATNGITITKLVLQTATGLSDNICGYFNYTFPDIASTDLSQGTFAIPEDAADYKQITMEFDTPVNFTKEGQYLDATFFLLPKTGDAVYESDDLKLTIFYTLKDNNGIEIPQSKTAVIGRELASRKKYYFADMNMPAIGDVFSSNWFSAVPEPVYISQLSIPAASNTFSYYYSATNADAKYIREQVHPYTDLWNMGVRGFEFVTSTNDTDNSIGSEGFVCAGSEIEFTFDDGSKLTFDKAFTDLTQYLNNEAYPQFANECLVIICRYQSYTGDGGDGIDPQLYLNQLCNYLNTKTNVDFVKVTPTSCAGDLRGKVAVIVRPGDNCYGATDALNIPEGWEDKITVIGDWGSSVDVWDRRFGNTYQREGVVTNNTATNIVEQSLWAVKEATTSTDYLVSYKDGYPTTDNFNFYHTVNGTADAAFIQDFLRVIPTSLDNKECETTIRGYRNSDVGHWNPKGYLYVKWPSSIQQKKDMVEETLDSVMATKGKDAIRIYINNLSGYYATENHVSSIYPYAGSNLYSMDGGYLSDFYFSIPTSGAGGDYPGLAADINTFFYDKIKDLNENTSGPFGLVMMNYIGATATEFQTSEYITDGSDAAAASSALPTKILMNNFSFPLMMNENYYNGL